MLSCHSSQSEKSVRRKTEQIEETSKILHRRDEKIGIVRFATWRECEDMSFSYLRKGKSRFLGHAQRPLKMYLESLQKNASGCSDMTPFWMFITRSQANSRIVEMAIEWMAVLGS